MSLLDDHGPAARYRRYPILRDIDLAVDAGEVLGVIGESGSGKSMTALSIMDLLPHGAQTGGSIRLLGDDLLAKSEREMNAVRGRDDRHGVPGADDGAQSAQDHRRPGGRDDPRARRGESRARRWPKPTAMLDRVGLPRDRFPRDRYPHELSGGQRQRVVIAVGDRAAAQAADRRRADHRARRHHAGADPRTAAHGSSTRTAWG